MHLHSRHSADARPIHQRLLAWLGFRLVTTQAYILFYPGDSATAEWCPDCRRGTLFSFSVSSGAAQRSPITSLRQLIGRDDTPPVGWATPLHERTR